MRHPAVAVADRTPRAVRKRAADDHRRVWLLHRLRPGHHRIEVDELAVIFGLGLSPDHLHRLDALTRDLVARLEWRAVVRHFLGVPAGADTEQEPPRRYLVDRGHQLRGLDWIALLHQANAGADLQRLRRRGGSDQRDERIHHVVVLLRQIAAIWERRSPRHGNMRMLRRPERLEAALLECAAKLAWRHRIVGEEHRSAEMHVGSPRWRRQP